MSITPFPVLPNRQQPTTFADDADRFLSALPTFVTEVNALAVQYENDAAILSMNTPLVIAAANFKGQWSSLAGALNVPASVYHNGSYWALASNLANVATKTPGIDAEWLPLAGNGGYVDASKDVFSGTYLVSTASGSLTVTLPSLALTGTLITFVNAANTWEANPVTVARNGKTIMGLSENFIIDSDVDQLTFWLNGTDWRIV